MPDYFYRTNPEQRDLTLESWRVMRLIDGSRQLVGYCPERETVRVTTPIFSIDAATLSVVTCSGRRYRLGGRSRQDANVELAWCCWATERGISWADVTDAVWQAHELATAEPAKSYAPTTYVKCPSCGWLHFVVSAECARQQVAEVNAHLRSLGERERASLDSYMHCFRCGEDSAGFLPAVESDAPAGVTIQPVVTER